MIEVVLYTKAGCGLCEEVKELLEELAFSYPHQLKEVDITQDPTLHRKYALTIPVVRIGKMEIQAPITAVQLHHLFQKAVSCS